MKEKWRKLRGDTRWWTCEYCGKKTYESRRAAKSVIKKAHRGLFAAMNVYQCREGSPGYHIGHRPGGSA